MIPMHCPKCGNLDLKKNGIAIGKHGQYQRYVCPDPGCGFYFIDKRGIPGRTKYVSSLKPAQITEKPMDRFFDLDVTTEVDYDA